jgi:hypothetical protein
MNKVSAYVFYVNRPDLLDRALLSFPTLLSAHVLTIVDNSGCDQEITQQGGPVRYYQPPVPLTYAQSMNWMLKDAKEQGSNIIIHFHSDAYSTNPDAEKELLEKVFAYEAEGRKWACAWTHYDILWAINVKALEDIGGWDVNLPTYYGDNDAKRRWQLAGWECIDTHIKGIDHEGSATINSDPMLKFMNAQVFPLHSYYYQQKWGGEAGHEKYDVPFGRTDLFGRRLKE